MLHYLVVCLVDFVVVFLALSNRSNPAAKALALTAFSMGLWSMELFLLTVIKDLEILTLWFHLTRWGMFFIAPSITLLVWRLVGGENRVFLFFLVIPSFVFAGFLSVTNLFFLPSTLSPAIGGFLPKIDIIFYLFAGGFIVNLLSTIAYGAIKFKSATHREKQKIRWLLITVLLILMLGLISMFLVKYNFYLKLVGAVANIGFVSLLFYATIQNNLMDVRSAISVGMTRAAILAAIVWVYVYVIGFVDDVNESFGGVALMVVFVVVVLEVYPRLLKWVLPSAKKIFVKNGYEFDQVKEDTERALSNSMTFDMMIDVLDHLFLKIVKVHGYKILVVQPEPITNETGPSNAFTQNPVKFVSEKHKLVSFCVTHKNLIMADEVAEDIKIEMTQYNAALCFSVRANNKILAVVMVSSPVNLSYYRYDDIKICEWLSGELGHVLNRLIRLDSMQDQLGEAKKTLSMLSMMSHYHHDIKAPFAIIDGVLSNDIYDREKQKNIVLEQVERGSRLIATMASILGGKHRRRVQPCILESLIQDCLFVFESSFDRIDSDIASIPRIMGDPEDLKILFINLIKNATEARRANEDLSVGVKLWKDDAYIYFSIKDNGMGMNEQQLSLLWEQEQSTKLQGSGIGMQAIKRIADEHSAVIEVQSHLGVGSEFTVRFSYALIVDEDAYGVKDELIERRLSPVSDAKNTN